jgi:hypothetical protein
VVLPRSTQGGIAAPEGVRYNSDLILRSAF